jgi:hypothetical protein
MLKIILNFQNSMQIMLVSKNIQRIKFVNLKNNDVPHYHDFCNSVWTKYLIKALILKGLNILTSLFREFFYSLFDNFAIRVIDNIDSHAWAQKYCLKYCLSSFPFKIQCFCWKSVAGDFSLLSKYCIVNVGETMQTPAKVILYLV